MITQTEIERHILSVLSQAKPYTVEEEKLWRFTSTLPIKPIVRPEFEAALKSLVDREAPQVARIPTDDGPRYKITAEGEARLV